MNGVEYFRRIGAELMKAQIEVQLDEYEREIAAASEFMSDYRKRMGIAKVDHETGEILPA